MDNEFGSYRFAKIQEYDYSKYFQDKHYKNKTLNEAERRDQISMMDNTISQFTSDLSLPMDEINESRGKEDMWNKINYTLSSSILFVIMTMADNVVISKYFLLADKDYDRRVLRGKLMAINNEGFKKLYGFEEKTKKHSEWAKLQPIMKAFPSIIQRQYDQLTALLEEQSQKDSWWKDERNVETHLDAEGLYRTRNEEIVESEVMMNSMRLFNALLAVHLFLKNTYGCIYNFLLGKYYRGELTK